MAFDAFLKIEGIPGESADRDHKDWIEILSWSWGSSNPSTVGPGSGGGAGKVQMQDFHFVHRVDKASPKLMESCCNGQHIKDAKLSVRKSGDQPVQYLKVTLSDILVSSFQVGGNSGGDSPPMEQISLNFAKVEMIYTGQNADGTPSKGSFGTCSPFMKF